MILTDDEALAKKFNSAIFPGIQGGPLMHVIAAKAVAFGRRWRAGIQGISTPGHRQRGNDGRPCSDEVGPRTSSPAANRTATSSHRPTAVRT